MILFKSCPKCHGDLLVDRMDDINCIQCGYRLYPRPLVYTQPSREPMRRQVRTATLRHRGSYT